MLLITLSHSRALSCILCCIFLVLRYILLLSVSLYYGSHMNWEAFKSKGTIHVSFCLDDLDLRRVSISVTSLFHCRLIYTIVILHVFLHKSWYQNHFKCSSSDDNHSEWKHFSTLRCNLSKFELKIGRYKVQIPTKA